MGWHQPCLPINHAFNLPVQEDQYSPASEYVRNLKNHLKDSYQIAIDKAAKITQKNNTRFDRFVTSDQEAGDQV